MTNRVPAPDPDLFPTPHDYVIACIGGVAVTPHPDDESRAALRELLASVAGTPDEGAEFCVSLAGAAVSLIAQTASKCDDPDCRGVHLLGWRNTITGKDASMEEAVDDPATRAVLRAFVACAAGDDPLVFLEQLDPFAPETIAAHVAAFGLVTRAVINPIGAVDPA